jgi:hypothetical protein
VKFEIWQVRLLHKSGLPFLLFSPSQTVAFTLLVIARDRESFDFVVLRAHDDYQFRQDFTGRCETRVATNCALSAHWAKIEREIV